MTLMGNTNLFRPDSEKMKQKKTRKGSMLGTWGAAPLFAQFLNGSNAFGEGRARSGGG